MIKLTPHRRLSRSVPLFGIIVVVALLTLTFSRAPAEALRASDAGPQRASDAAAPESETARALRLSEEAAAAQAAADRQRRAEHAYFVSTLDKWDAHVDRAAEPRPSLALAPADADAPKRTLVVYAYAHAEWRLSNLEFFLRHGLVERTADGAEVDYTFVVNGYDAPLDSFRRAGVAFSLLVITQTAETRTETDASGYSPKVLVIVRENVGFDMCASKIVLERGLAARPGTYTHVVLMNGSVRGPFMPTYAAFTWVDAFQQFLRDGVRMVGTTINCLGSLRHATAGFTSLHAQSMLLALDATGARALQPMLDCYPSIIEAISHGEIGSTQAVLAAGYGVRVMQASWRDFPIFLKDLATSELNKRCAAVSDSAGGDPSIPGAYAESEVHPLELIFIKTNRALDEVQLRHETQLRDNFAKRQSGQKA
jgi:hypothetical protein